jgi:hypothetical protein
MRCLSAVSTYEPPNRIHCGGGFCFRSLVRNETIRTLWAGGAGRIAFPRSKAAKAFTFFERPIYFCQQCIPGQRRAYGVEKQPG